jgi:hypothetical protein
MKIPKLKIFYYLVFVVYLSSINVHQFFHHHEEEHGNDGSSNRLHTHSFDNSKNDSQSIQSEFHSTDNKYFDEKHTLNSFSFLITNSVIIISSEEIEFADQENSTFTNHQFRKDINFSRDTYVLTESNLPPPIS